VGDLDPVELVSAALVVACLEAVTGAEGPRSLMRLGCAYRELIEELHVQVSGAERIFAPVPHPPGSGTLGISAAGRLDAVFARFWALCGELGLDYARVAARAGGVLAGSRDPDLVAIGVALESSAS
jgi:hypothetical protein